MPTKTAAELRRSVVSVCLFGLNLAFQSMPNAHFGEITKALASEWKELSKAEKAPYEKLAAADRARYERECARA